MVSRLGLEGEIEVYQGEKRGGAVPGRRNSQCTDGSVKVRYAWGRGRSSVRLGQECWRQAFSWDGKIGV